MKNYKALGLLLGLFFLQAAYIDCNNSQFNPISRALLSGASLRFYKGNSCIRLCRPEDIARADAILCQHNLQKQIRPQVEMLTLLHEKNSQIAGVCIAGFDGYVHRLAVDKHFSKQGIGKDLLQEAIFRLQSEHKVQSLNVRSVQSAIPFYEKMGFDFYGHRYEYALGSLAFEKE